MYSAHGVRLVQCILQTAHSRANAGGGLFQRFGVHDRLHIYPLCGAFYFYLHLYIIREEASIFAPQRLRFYRALGVAACTVGKVRASTVFMCVCSMFRPRIFLLFIKNRFVVGVRCQGNRDPPADGATTPLSQRHAWLALPKQ